MRRVKGELEEICEKPEESEFWRVMRDDMEAVGKTRIGSVTGQFATFERSLPG